jgi:hypothetical protein
VRANEAAAERLRATFDQLAHRDTGRVAGDNRGRGDDAFEPRVERLLRFKLLDDRLDDPVAVSELVEVVFGVAKCDERCAVAVHERLGLCFQRPVQSPFHWPIAVAVVFPAGNIEQHNRHASRCGQCSDSRPHRPRANDADLADIHGAVALPARAPSPAVRPI